MLWLPSLRIRSSASRDAPSPIASIAMTLPTPKTSPSMVRKLLSLCSSRFFTPSAKSRLSLANGSVTAPP